MSAQSLTAFFSFEIEADIFRMQRRPHHRQVIVNDDHGGIRVLDPFTGRDVSRVEYCREFASGLDTAWAVRADGALVLAFDDEARSACVLSLESATSRSAPHPPWRSTVGMPYDWRGDLLWMKDPDAFAFASLDGGAMRIEKDDGMRALQENRLWRRAIDRMRRLEAACLRVEPELGQALVATTAEGISKVGAIGWLERPESMVAVDPGCIQVAAVGGWIASLHEFEWVLADPAGSPTRRIGVDEGFHYVDVVAFPRSETRPATVVTAAAAVDGRLVTRISLHAV